MNPFSQWLTSLGGLRNYAVEKDQLAMLQWLWRDYCDATFHSAIPSVTLPDSYLDAKVKALYDAVAGNPLTKRKLATTQLNTFSQQLINSYRKDNIPTTDNDTLCIYHAFSNVGEVPQQQRSPLVLCTAWKTERFVADLSYDDDRCVRNMAVKYGFKKWSPLKGQEILAHYKTPGTELIISIFQDTNKIPVKYWTDGTWHNKEFDIEGSAVLDTMLTDPGTYGHCVYAKVERDDLVKFYDNKNNQGKATTQIQSTAKTLRCLVYSKPPA